LDTWTFSKEVDNPELQGLARIRGHLDFMAQQLAALGEIEEAHKAEKNVVLEKMEHARVELFTAIDSAMPNISHETAIVQAALEFVELPGDRERLRSPGRVHPGDRSGEGGRAYAGRPKLAPAPAPAPARHSPRNASVAGSAPRSLNFTDVDSSGDEGGAEGRDDDYNDDDSDNDATPGSGWVVVVVGCLAAVLGAGVHVNRHHTHVVARVRRWTQARLGGLRRCAATFAKQRPVRPGAKKPHVQPRSHASSGAQRHASTSASTHERRHHDQDVRAREKARDTRGAMSPSLTASERTTGQVGGQVAARRAPEAPPLSPTRPRPPSASSNPSAQSHLTPPPPKSPVSPPSSPPRAPSTQRVVATSGSVASRNQRSWRWRPHVLLGRG
jgi:hypothetical protein